MLTLKDLHAEFQAHANTQKASSVAMFFKTAPGQYGHGDKFLRITVPTTRSILKKYSHFVLKEIEELLSSEWHEERLGGAILLANLDKKAHTPSERKTIAEFYIKNSKKINNWDLVDSSAEYTLGAHLEDFSYKDCQKKLTPLITSENLWTRRIAIISTFHFIKNKKPELTIWVSEKLLTDSHDLIHKAVGWMLREVGKRCGEKALTDFLDKHKDKMPRTALRYSTERLSVRQKEYYLRKLPKNILR